MCLSVLCCAVQSVEYTANSVRPSEIASHVEPRQREHGRSLIETGCPPASLSTHYTETNSNLEKGKIFCSFFYVFLSRNLFHGWKQKKEEKKGEKKGENKKKEKRGGVGRLGR